MVLLIIFHYVESKVGKLQFYGYIRVGKKTCKMFYGLKCINENEYNISHTSFIK